MPGEFLTARGRRGALGTRADGRAGTPVAPAKPSPPGAVKKPPSQRRECTWLSHDCSLTLASERGAVIVHVAIALVGLMAFSAFVIDYGVMWAARRQAQNSADAGAHGGRDLAGLRRFQQSGHGSAECA